MMGDTDFEKQDASPDDVTAADAAPAADDPGSATTAEPTPEEVIAALQAELEEERNRALRAVADLHNYRRRTQEDHAQRMRYACSGLLTDLVSVLDHFEMAVEAAEANEHAQVICKGYEMILQQLLDVARRHGLEEIEACEGMYFDPDYHEAVERVATVEPCEGTVMKVLRKGYKLHDRVLRPVQVGVAVAPETE